MNLVKVISLFLFILFFSCQKSSLTAEEMEEYILKEDNGLIQSEMKDNMKVQAVFRPWQLIALQELKNRNIVSAEQIKEQTNNYRKNIYITLNISEKDRDPLYKQGDVQKYSIAMQDLAFHLSDKACIITSAKDTIRVGDYVFPHMYGMSDAISVMFAFPAGEIKEYSWVDFELKDPGMNIGNRKFRFEKAAIDEVPELNF
jgi:hypothetical protein